MLAMGNFNQSPRGSQNGGWWLGATWIAKTNKQLSTSNPSKDWISNYNEKGTLVVL